MITLSDLYLDLRAAERNAADLRGKLHTAQRSGIPTRLVEGRLCMAERRIDRLTMQVKAVLAAIDKLAREITMFAAAGLDHDTPEMQRLEVRILDLLGCEPLDADRWPYAAAALRAREQPEDAETFVGFVRARQVLMAGERRAA